MNLEKLKETPVRCHD